MALFAALRRAIRRRLPRRATNRDRKYRHCRRLALRKIISQTVGGVL